MNYREMYAQALRFSMESDIAEYEKQPNHKFSRRFERRMKKLISQVNTLQYTPVRARMPLKKALAIAAIIVLASTLLVGATIAGYKLWESFYVRDYSDFSTLYISQIEGAPKTLEEKYDIGADMSGYVRTVTFENEYMFCVDYTVSDTDKWFSFEQTTRGISEQTWLDTEDAIVMPREVTVSGYKGFFCQDKYGARVLVWDTGDYILSAGGNPISEEELMRLAESVQRIDN